MAVKIYDVMTTATDAFPLAYAEKINIVKQDGSEASIQTLFNNGELGGSGGSAYVQLSQDEYDNLTDDERLDGREFRTYDTGHIYRLGVEFGKDACFTSLSQVGLTADATIEDVVNALKSGESFLAPVNTFTNYETIFPNKLPNDQWNKIHIIKGTSLANSHIRCFSQSGTCEYLANINNTNVVSWNDVSGTYIDISDSTIEKLGNEILKYPVGKYRINSTTTGNKFIDLPSDSEIKCGLIEVNGTAVGKSPFTDTWVYRMYKFECLTGSLVYTRRLNSGATVGQIESDTGWCVKQNIYTSLKELGLDTTATINDIIGKMANGSQFTYKTDVFDYATEYNNIQYGTVTIHKQSVSRVQVFMTDKDTGNLYVGRMDNSNKIVKWSKMITNMSDPYACTSYTVLTGTEDLFTLPCGHYASNKVNTTYNYPITDSTNVLAHIYVLGHLNDPVNNKGYRIIFYYDNKGRAYRINEWWGVFSNGWQEIATKSISEEPIILRYNMAETFSYPKYGITHNNTITEVVRAIGNYYASKYNNNQNITLQVILSTNYNSSTFNKSLPCNGRSSITTITYMPYKFASRVKIETMNTHTGETYLGSLNDSETDDIVWKEIATKSIYNSVAELNRAKGTSIELVNGEDNTKKIVDALSVGEQFISFYHNNANQNRFGIDVSYGNLIHELRITKCLDADLTANYATVTAFMNTGCVLSRIYYKTYSTAWSSTKDYVESLLANSQVR